MTVPVPKRSVFELKGSMERYKGEVDRWVGLVGPVYCCGKLAQLCLW